MISSKNPIEIFPLARLSPFLNVTLIFIGMKEDDIRAKHVQFEGYDKGADGSPYGASIPISKVTSFDHLQIVEIKPDTLKLIFQSQ